MTLEERIRKFIEDMRKVDSAVVPAVIANDLQEIVDAANAPPPSIGLASAAPLQATIRGWQVSASCSDGRTWLRLDTPEGSSAVFSCVSHTGSGAETVTSQVAHYFADSFNAAFKGNGRG